MARKNTANPYPWVLPTSNIGSGVISKLPGGSVINDIRQSPWQWLDKQEKGPLGAAANIFRKLFTGKTTRPR